MTTPSLRAHLDTLELRNNELEEIEQELLWWKGENETSLHAIRRLFSALQQADDTLSDLRSQRCGLFVDIANANRQLAFLRTRNTK